MARYEAGIVGRYYFRDNTNDRYGAWSASEVSERQMKASWGKAFPFDPLQSSVVFYLRANEPDLSTYAVNSNTKGAVVNLLNGSFVTTAKSKFGTGSIVFDGIDDYVLLGDVDDVFIPTNDFCIETWVNFTSLKSSATVGSKNTVFAAGNLTGNEERVLFGLQACSSPGVAPGTNETNEFTLYWADGSGAYTTLKSGIVPVLDTWYHVAVTRDNLDLKLYIDGVYIGLLVTERLVSSDIVFEQQDIFVYLGANFAIDSLRNLDGHLDSFRITNNQRRYAATFNPETDTYLT